MYLPLKARSEWVAPRDLPLGGVLDTMFMFQAACPASHQPALRPTRGSGVGVVPDTIAVTGFGMVFGGVGGGGGGVPRPPRPPAAPGAPAAPAGSAAGCAAGGVAAAGAAAVGAAAAGGGVRAGWAGGGGALGVAAGALVVPEELAQAAVNPAAMTTAIEKPAKSCFMSWTSLFGAAAALQHLVHHTDLD